VCLSVADGDHQPPPQVERGVPFLVIGNVRDGQIDFSETRFVPESYFRSLAQQRKPSRGDVLYSVTGSFGIPVLVTTDQSFCVQRHIAILKPAAKISSGYLARALGTAAVFRQASDAATGTAQKTVGLKQLRKFTVPIAPLREQHRIVEAIESYFTRLDDAVATLERVQRNLKRYRASVLKAAGEGRLVPTEAELARAEGRDYEPASTLLERILYERRRRWQEADGRGTYQEPVSPDARELPQLPEGWCWATVDQLSLEVRYGSSAKAHEERDGGIPVVRMGNIIDGFLDLTELKYLPASHDEFPDLLLQPGDLLFNRTNSAELVGKTAVFHGQREPCSFASYLIRVRMLQGAHPDFVSHYINSLAGRTWIASVVSQQVGQANVNGTKLRACTIPLPPSNEQHRIVGEVDRLLSVASATAQAASADHQRCQRLRHSILKWAFAGKLADQDHSDEPASALLERIRSQTLASRPSAGDTGDRRRRRGDRRPPVRAENKP
jgi:type I restriction enzyme, S subunit